MKRRFLSAVVTASLLLAACGDDDDGAGGATTAPATAHPGTTSAGSTTVDGAASSTSAADLDGTELTLVTHDSFPERGDESPVNEALDAFTAETGIEVDVLHAGDAGTMVSKATLTAGNPEGDVMYGVDNTFLSRVVDEGVFEPYEAAGLDTIPAELREMTPNAEATPVDFGDVCINYDIAWYVENGIDPPTTFADLADEQYADQLVVENPATSSPGLAFLLATIAEYGEDGWTDYWSQLRDNGVEVVDDWEVAYNERFSGSFGQGPKPLVVSYGSSPPAEVIYAVPPRDDAPTGVMEATCFRQIEYAGVLAGTGEPEAARRLVDFLISAPFQETLALNLFVYPASERVDLPPEFVEYAVVPDDPATLDPEAIGDHRADWTDEWTKVVLR